MADNPNPSLLSQQQIIQEAYDEAEERLRVVQAQLNPIDDAVSISDPLSGNDLVINADGSINTKEVNPGSTTVTSINALTTNQTALVANVNRKGAILYRQGTGTLYIKLGANVTISDYTVQLANNGVFELPHPVYTGRIDVIFSNTNGSLKITEIF